MYCIDLNEFSVFIFLPGVLPRCVTCILNFTLHCFVLELMEMSVVKINGYCPGNKLPVRFCYFKDLFLTV